MSTRRLLQYWTEGCVKDAIRLVLSFQTWSDFAVRKRGWKRNRAIERHDWLDLLTTVYYSDDAAVTPGLAT